METTIFKRAAAVLLALTLLLLAALLVLPRSAQAIAAHAATDGVVQASGEGVLNANRVNIRPAPSTKNTPLGKAGKGDVFRVTGFTIPSGFSQGFFQVSGESITGSAYIAANYLNVTFDAPPTGEITKKGYLYTAKSTSRKYRAGTIAVGDTLPLLAREGKWWRTELNGQTLWAQIANVQSIQGASTPAAPASGILLTPSTTKSTYGSLRVSVSGVEGASFVGWRRHTPGATYTDKAGFANITASGRFTATANGWYAVGVVDAQGQFRYELIQITNIVEYTEDSEPVTYTLTVNVLTACGPSSGSVGIVNLQASYAPGTSVTVTATAVAPYEFFKWVTADNIANVAEQSGGADAGASYTFNITGNTTLYAVFSADSTSYNNATGITITNGEVTNGAGASGAVNIPNVVDGVAVTSIAQNAFLNNETITSVTLPDTLQSIGEGAIYGCTFLTGTLEIPASVTTLGINAFAFDKSLTSVTFLGNKPTTLALDAFWRCTGLTGIHYLPGTDWTGTEEFEISTNPNPPPQNITITATQK